MVHPADVLAVAADPKGRRVATLDDDDDVRLWTVDGDLIATTDEPKWFNLKRLVFSEDGASLAASGQTPHLVVLDVEDDLRAFPIADYPEFREVLKKVSIADALINSPYARLLTRVVWYTRGDYIHTNGIDVVGPELAAKLPMAKPGQVLLSFREIDTTSDGWLQSVSRQ